MSEAPLHVPTYKVGEKVQVKRGKNAGLATILGLSGSEVSLQTAEDKLIVTALTNITKRPAEMVRLDVIVAEIQRTADDSTAVSAFNALERLVGQLQDRGLDVPDVEIPATPLDPSDLRA